MTHDANSRKSYLNSAAEASSLRKYLLCSPESRAESLKMHADAFDDFFRDVEKMQSLRVLAEDNFRENPHVAKRARGPLPLTGTQIQADLKNADGAPVRLIVRAALACDGTLSEIRRDFRKILSRERRETPLNKVTQLDTTCMARLGTRPGKTLAEKAGSAQRILAIVKRENFNVLENRVLKDFLHRAMRLCDDYLREFGRGARESDKNLRRVEAFQRLCAAVAAESALSAVPANRGLPRPNYVLQQNPHYSQIWRFYKEFLAQTQLLETLWEHRAELDETLSALKKYARIPDESTDAGMADDDATKMSSDVLWFRPISNWRKDRADGVHALGDRFLENPFWENARREQRAGNLPETPIWRLAAGTAATNGKPTETRIIDLATGAARRNLLVYSARHGNAKPYLQDFLNPRKEDFRENNGVFDVNEIFAATRANDGNALQDRRFAQEKETKIRDYFEQLDGVLRANDGNAAKKSHWLILVPDEWSQFMQESVIRAVPAPRGNVTLLWRSVASALRKIDALRATHSDGNAFFVEETAPDGFWRQTQLRLKKNELGNLVPVRRAPATHPNAFKVAVTDTSYELRPSEQFFDGKRQTQFSENSVAESNSVGSDGIVEGAKRFLEMPFHGETPYYDELDALSLVVQTPDEKLVWKTIVAGRENWPGGKEFRPKTIENAAYLARGETEARFYLRVGRQDPNSPLKVKIENIAEAFTRERAMSLAMTAHCVPGQGFAQITVENSERNFSTLLDLSEMADANTTKNELEAALPRSFPPDLPLVEFDEGWWHNEENAAKLNAYIDAGREHVGFVNGWFVRDGRRLFQGNFFAQARPKFPEKAPVGTSPLDRLIRVNVFGQKNAENIPFPRMNELFETLAAHFTETQKSWAKIALTRLIAWTYQAAFPPFQKIKREVFAELKELLFSQGSSLRNARNTSRDNPFESAKAAIFLSLCGNLFVDRKEIREFYQDIILPCVRARPSAFPSQYAGHIFRAFSYLIQYNENFIEFSECAKTPADAKELTTGLVKWLRFFHDDRAAAGNSGNHANAVVRCLMFLLKIRKKKLTDDDSYRYMDKDKDTELYLSVTTALRDRFDELERRRLQKTFTFALYESALAYIAGKGTLDGIPMN